MKPQAGIVLGFILLVLLVGCGEDMENNEEEEITKAPAKQRVEIPDTNLRYLVERALGKTSGTTITAEDMATIKELDVSGYIAAVTNPTKDLTGLEFATGLTYLKVDPGYVADLTPIAGLTQLERLVLFGSRAAATNLTPLAGLTNLEYLELWRLVIEDLTFLAELTQLKRLSITRAIKYDDDTLDISALAGLTNLRRLIIGRYNIVDLTPLGELTQLVELDLFSCGIEDLTPLAELTNLTHLNLANNNVTDFSPLAGMTKLVELRIFNSIWDHSSICDMHLEVDVPVRTEGFDCE